MKKIILFVLAFVFIVACMETPPKINYGNNNVVFLKDTTYTLSEADIPSAQGLNVMVDDFTGIRCINCPEITQAGKNLEKDYPGRIFLTAHYPTSPGSLTTPYAGYEDIRNSESQDIANNIAMFANILPAHMINRRVFPGRTGVNLAGVDTANWKGLAVDLLNENAIVNLDVALKRASDSVVELQSELVFQSAPPEDVFVSISVLENNIKQPQSGPDSTIYGYKHSHVMRKMFTQFNGDLLIASSDVVRGTKIEKGWSLTIPDGIDQSNMEFVVTISYNSASSNEIIQCLKVDLN